MTANSLRYEAHTAGAGEAANQRAINLYDRLLALGQANHCSDESVSPTIRAGLEEWHGLISAAGEEGTHWQDRIVFHDVITRQGYVIPRLELTHDGRDGRASIETYVADEQGVHPNHRFTLVPERAPLHPQTREVRYSARSVYNPQAQQYDTYVGGYPYGMVTDFNEEAAAQEGIAEAIEHHLHPDQPWPTIEDMGANNGATSQQSAVE